MTLDQLYSEFGLEAGIATAMFVLLVWAMTSLAWRLRKRSEVHRMAYVATRDYYDISDEVLSDPDTPEPIREALKDLLLAVTDEEAGKVAYAGGVSEVYTSMAGGNLSSSLKELQRTRPDLHERTIEAIRAGVAAIIYGQYHAGARVAKTVQSVTRTNMALLKHVEPMAEVISNHLAVKMKAADI